MQTAVAPKPSPSTALPKALELVADELLLKLSELVQAESERYRMEFPRKLAEFEVTLANYEAAPVRRFFGLISEPQRPVTPEQFVPHLHLYREVTPLYNRDFERMIIGVLASMEEAGLVRTHDFGHVHYGPDYFIEVTTTGLARAQELRRQQQ